jgi:hypothetical protein
MKSVLLFLFSLSSFALVDYSDSSESSSSFRPSSAKKPTVKRVASSSASRRAARKSGPSHIELDLDFRSIDYIADSREGKVNKLSVDGHLQTDYDFFVDFHMPFYTGMVEENQADTDYQKGNGEIDLGINWFTAGNRDSSFALDTTFGMTMGTKSPFASSRTDKKVGVEMSRRFFNVGLGLGYHLTMTGSPDDNEVEQDIGNISTLSLSLGWVVSSDIKFLVKASSHKVSQSTNETMSNRLNNDIKFATISPQIVLTMSPGLDLKLNATFLTRRPKSEYVSTQARLWGLEGFYGNTLSAGLGFKF